MATFQRFLIFGGLLGLALFPATSFASTGVGEVEFGIKGGLTIGSCSGFDSLFDPEDWGTDVPDVKKGSRTGGAFGGFATYWFASSIGVQVELIWAQGGCTRDFDIDIPEITGKLESTAALTYVEIPVLLRYSFMGYSESSPFVVLGPSVGFRTTADLEMDATAEGLGTKTFTEDIGDYVKSTNFSLMVGAGYTFRGGQFSFSIEGRYVLGLIDVMEETGRVEIEDNQYILIDETKPRTIAIMVTVGR